MNLGSIRLSRSAGDVMSRSRLIWSWAVIGILFIVAALGNIYVVPGEHIVTALFAIEILLAAIWFSVPSIVAVSVIAVALYIVTAVVNRQPFLVGLLGSGGLILVGYLAVELSRERERARAHLDALRRANDELKLSEERLRVGLSLANVTVYNQDTNLRYTGVFNPHELLPAESVIGKTELDVLPPDLAHELMEFKRQALESGTAVRADRAVTIGGDTRIYDMRVEPLRDQSGTIIGLTGSSIEISDRIAAEEERMFEAMILANIRNSVIVTDLDGRVTYWNRGAREIFGYEPQEAVNRPLLILSPEEDPSRLSTYRDRILAGDEYSGELLERRKDGRPVWVDLKISPLRNSSGQAIGFIRVANDITDRKQLEEEREELLRRERLALTQLQQFIALVAHDLDQPLTTIHGVAQILERSTSDRLSESEQRRIRSIRNATQRMSRLTGDLRQAVAIGSGHFTINTGQMDLMRIAQRVVSEQQEMTAQHHVFLNGPDSVPGVWDRDRVIQLLTNLISNAIKYSPEGGDIYVRVEATPETVTFSVNDSGIGMHEDQIRQLFEPFARVHDDIGVTGSGLGLYICKGIVEAHHGRIDVESQPGHGSTFTVTLPREVRSDPEP